MWLPEENVVELDVTVIGSVLACSLHEVGEFLGRSDVHADWGNWLVRGLRTKWALSVLSVLCCWSAPCEAAPSAGCWWCYITMSSLLPPPTPEHLLMDWTESSELMAVVSVQSWYLEMFLVSRTTTRKINWIQTFNSYLKVTWDLRSKL